MGMQSVRLRSGRAHTNGNIKSSYASPQEITIPCLLLEFICALDYVKKGQLFACAYSVQIRFIKFNFIKRSVFVYVC